jgi:hypothetical protein
MNENENILLAAGAVVAAVAAAVVLGSDDTAADGAQSTLGRVTNSVEQAVSSAGNDPASMVPSVSDFDVAGALDGAVGSLDERIGGSIQSAADTLGSGPGDLVDSLASESVGQAAVRSMFPGVAAAETAVQAANDVQGSSSPSAGVDTGEGDDAGSTETTASEQDTLDDIDSSPAWEGVDTDAGGSSGGSGPNIDAADDPENRLNDTDGDGEADSIDLSGLY